jgi:hypothetical protein
MPFSLVVTVKNTAVLLRTGISREMHFAIGLTVGPKS